MSDPIELAWKNSGGAGPFTARAVAFAVSSSLAWILAQSFVGPLSGFYATGEGAFAMVFLAMVLFKGKLRPAECALIFGMVEAASITSIEIGAMAAAPLAINAFPALTPLLDAVPDFYRISNRSVESALLGGSAIPLDLSPAILATFFVNSSFLLLIVLTSVFFRKAFVEVEKLPFPVARASHAVTKILTPVSSVEQGLERRVFWEGAVIGFLLVAVTEGYFLGQELPFLSLIPSSFNEAVYKALSSLLPGSLMGFYWGGAVWTMWFLYMAPAESTLTAAAANLLAYVILAPFQAEFKMVGWDASMSYGEFYSKLCGGGPLSYSWLGAGLLLSSATVPLVANFRSFFPKLGLSEAPRLKRSSLAFAIVLASVFLGGHLMSSPPLLSVFAVAATLLGCNLWLTRSLAELNTIQPTQDLLIGSTWALGSCFAGFTLGKPSRGAYGAIAFSYALSTNATLGAGCTEAFTIASLTGMRCKDMAYALAFGALAAALVGPLLFLSMVYASGFPSSPNDPRNALWLQAFNGSGSNAALSYLVIGVDPRPVNMPSFLLGFASGLLAMSLRSRFPSLAVSVAAAGVGFVTDPGNGFLVFLIPGLARLLTFKLGGMRLYESLGLPLFTGMSCGAILGTLLSSLNLMRRLFALS